MTEQYKLEQWKIIADYPLYMASTCGQIKNINNNHILVGGFDKDGYRQVTLQTGEKQVCRRVCRLIALTFLDNPHNFPCVNHKDENKTNDAVYNLEWCTYQYNNIYGNHLQSISKKVRCIELNRIFASTRCAEREMGICHSYISISCKNPHKTAGGYHWEYYNNQNNEVINNG